MPRPKRVIKSTYKVPEKQEERVDTDTVTADLQDEATLPECGMTSSNSNAPANTVASSSGSAVHKNSKPPGDKVSFGSSTRSKVNVSKCTKCKSRYGNGSCVQLACLPCCTDTDCVGHKKAREQAAWKESVLKGTTAEQRQAAAKRASAVRPKSFREPGFLYMGQTITIWNLDEYMSVPKWRDDAVRRSEKRRARREPYDTRPIKKPQNSRKRFHSIMERLYQEALTQK